ncbi:MAG: HNH endonuclease [Patescibacteria group bacterium]
MDKKKNQYLALSMLKMLSPESKTPPELFENPKIVEGIEYYKCHYCGDLFKMENITRDHVIPTSKGGANVLSNLVLACRFCNFAKSYMDYDEFVKLTQKRQNHKH